MYITITMDNAWTKIHRENIKMSNFEPKESLVIAEYIVNAQLMPRTKWSANFIIICAINEL